ALPVLPLGARVRAAFGSPSTATAEAVTGSIEQAARAARAGAASAVVTNPIQKSVLMEAGFAYPGHTEYIAALTADDQNGPDSRPEPVMMIASPALRVVPLSIHVSLRDALTNIETGKIIRTGLTLHAALKQDFGIARPRIAVAGLNPHAGEGGAFGEEEIAQIAPAIAALQAEGVAAIGPLPPDTMFHEEARATYDAALCMYHDQALIPAKTLDFHGGVNVTLGLAIVRTSPDHGVALDLAGTGRARPDSLIAAIRLAGEIAARRAPA
ncbi:MAG: 4-hydroxythreonine-4-phosphate dehydrogenase PdxA, partial [Pseudomonadota bacterium]